MKATDLLPQGLCDATARISGVRQQHIVRIHDSPGWWRHEVSSQVQAVLRRRYVQAALAACAAMAVRQNSAVWAAFSLGVR
jgi:hypothetical protein